MPDYNFREAGFSQNSHKIQVAALKYHLIAFMGKDALIKNVTLNCEEEALRITFTTRCGLGSLTELLKRNAFENWQFDGPPQNAVGYRVVDRNP